MRIPAGKILRCPCCGHDRFCVTVHVTQDWLIDSHAYCDQVIADCVEVTHFPGLDSQIGCDSCGHDGELATFLTDAPNPDN
jgi:hypothetical protein